MVDRFPLHMDRLSIDQPAVYASIIFISSSRASIMTRGDKAARRNSFGHEAYHVSYGTTG